MREASEDVVDWVMKRNVSYPIQRKKREDGDRQE